MHYRIVEPETAGKVVSFKAISLQNPGSDVAAQTALADDINGLSGFDLTNPIPQLIHRDVLEAVDMAPVAR